MDELELTPALYNAILAAWLETPSVRAVAHELDLPRDFVTKVRDEGMPNLGLPPLPPVHGTTVSKQDDSGKGKSTSIAPVPKGADMTLQAEILVARQEAQRYADQVKDWLSDIEARAEKMGVKADVAEARSKLDGTLTELEKAEARVRVQQNRLATVSETAVQADVLKRTADEAAAAHTMLNNCVTIGEIMSHIACRILESIQDGTMQLPEVADPKMLAGLATSADKLTSAMDRALKIKKGRGGESEITAGKQLGAIIDACTPDELQLIQTTGRLPSRFRYESDESD